MMRRKLRAGFRIVLTGVGLTVLSSFLAGWSGDALSGETSAPSEELPVLRVMNINLWHDYPFKADIDRRAEIIADTIRELRPDVVALQEVSQGPSLANRAQRLAQLTGYQMVWAKMNGYSWVFEEGLGILSRHPIVSTDSTELPHPHPFGGRGAMEVRVATPYGELAVVSTHLTLSSQSGTANDQAREAWRFATRETLDLPVFLMGDMNKEPDHESMRFLRGEFVWNDETGNLVDAWMATNGENDGYTFPSSKPSRRIDYIYMAPGRRGLGTVLNCKRLFTEPVDGVRASDHVGLICDFALPPQIGPNP